LTCTLTQAVAYLLDFNRLLSPTVGLPRATAAFHLDRLVEEDLLDVSYQRRTGPGAGRPAKLYRRSPHQVAVSLPQRRYDLAGQLLSSA
jgi:predicted ArsR family transcriptional regulator